MGKKAIFSGTEISNEVSNSAEANVPASNVASNNDEVLALKIENERLKADKEELSKNQKTKTPKQKTPYNKVTEKFRSSFGAQVIKSAEAKKAVFEKSLNGTNGITREDFCREFRDNVFDRLLVNIKFVSECIRLEVNPFTAAQYIVMNGNPTVELVLKSGVESVFGDSLDLLSGEIFTEEELATAKFKTLTLESTKEQITEAERLISAISKVLDVMKEAA